MLYEKKDDCRQAGLTNLVSTISILLSAGATGLCRCISLEKKSLSIIPVINRLAIGNSTVYAGPVTGKVTDENGKGLSGVTISIKGNTAKAVVTDEAGAFTITVATGEETLVFTYIGYASQEVDLKKRTTITVGMVQDSKALEDVVVIGYGTVKKRM